MLDVNLFSLSLFIFSAFKVRGHLSLLAYWQLPRVYASPNGMDCDALNAIKLNETAKKPLYTPFTRSSKRPANAFKIHELIAGSFAAICYNGRASSMFDGRFLDRVTGILITARKP